MSDEAATAEAANAYLLARPAPPQRIGAVAVGRGPATRRVADLEADLAASLERERESDAQLAALIADYDALAESQRNWRVLWFWTAALLAALVGMIFRGG